VQQRAVTIRAASVFRNKPQQPGSLSAEAFLVHGNGWCAYFTTLKQSLIMKFKTHALLWARCLVITAAAAVTIRPAQISVNCAPKERRARSIVAGRAKERIRFEGSEHEADSLSLTVSRAKN
jgi:hypothetical protein